MVIMHPNADLDNQICLNFQIEIRYLKGARWLFLR